MWSVIKKPKKQQQQHREREKETTTFRTTRQRVRKKENKRKTFRFFFFSKAKSAKYSLWRKQDGVGPAAGPQQRHQPACPCAFSVLDAASRRTKNEGSQKKTKEKRRNRRKINKIKIENETEKKGRRRRNNMQVIKCVMPREGGFSGPTERRKVPCV